MKAELAIAVDVLEKIKDNSLGYKPPACDISEYAQEALEKIK